MTMTNTESAALLACDPCGRTFPTAEALAQHRWLHGRLSSGFFCRTAAAELPVVCTVGDIEILVERGEAASASLLRLVQRINDAASSTDAVDSTGAGDNASRAADASKPPDIFIARMDGRAIGLLLRSPGGAVPLAWVASDFKGNGIEEALATAAERTKARGRRIRGPNVNVPEVPEVPEVPDALSETMPTVADPDPTKLPPTEATRAGGAALTPWPTALPAGHLGRIELVVRLLDAVTGPMPEPAASTFRESIDDLVKERRLARQPRLGGQTVPETLPMVEERLRDTWPAVVPATQVERVEIAVDLLDTVLGPLPEAVAAVVGESIWAQAANRRAPGPENREPIEGSERERGHGHVDQEDTIPHRAAPTPPKAAERALAAPEPHVSLPGAPTTEPMPMPPTGAS